MTHQRPGPQNEVMSFDVDAAVRHAMCLANAVGAAWARDERMDNPRTFHSPAAEQALREFLQQAFAEAANGVETAVPTRVLHEADRFCSSCGHNRDESSVSSIDEGNGIKSCQKCGISWRELPDAASVPDAGKTTDEV